MLFEVRLIHASDFGARATQLTVRFWIREMAANSKIEELLAEMLLM